MKLTDHFNDYTLIENQSISTENQSTDPTLESVVPGKIPATKASSFDTYRRFDQIITTLDRAGLTQSYFEQLLGSCVQGQSDWACLFHVLYSGHAIRPIVGR